MQGSCREGECFYSVGISLPYSLLSAWRGKNFEYGIVHFLNQHNEKCSYSYSIALGAVLSHESPESFLWGFTEALGTYIFIYSFSSIFFPKKKK